MAASYSLGVFNDNFFKQAAMLIAVRASMGDLQGYMLILFTCPYILLSAPCGWLADRFPKRQIVIFAKGLEVAAMVCGAVGLLIGSWTMILAMVCAMGLQSAIFGPSLNGSIPELYPASYVTRANGVLKVFVTGAILIGVALAGVLLDWRGRAAVAVAALTVAGLGFLCSFGVLRRPAASLAARFPWMGPIDSIRDLIRMRTDRLLLTTISADMFIWFAGSLLIPIVNELGENYLRVSFTVTGGLVAAELGGIAIGGMLAGRLAKGRRWYRVLVPSSLVLAGMLACAAGAAYLPEGMRYGVILAALGGAGVAGGLFMIPCEAFIQVRPGADCRGKVIAASNFAVFVGIAVSGGLAIALNRLVTPFTSLAIIAAIAFIAAGVLWLVLPGRARP